jgi:hypothetical protein
MSTEMAYLIERLCGNCELSKYCERVPERRPDWVGRMFAQLSKLDGLPEGWEHKMMCEWDPETLQPRPTELRRIRSALSIAMCALARISEDCHEIPPPSHREIVDFIGKMVDEIVEVLR